MKLKNCCDILDSKRIPITAANRKKGPYPYYGANGVQDYVDDYIFDDELVLLAEDGGNFGSKEKPIAYRISGKCWINNHAHVLKPKNDLNVDYLCYSLAFYNVDKLINGATRKKLTQSAVKDMEIPIVPLATQQKIVNQIKKVQLLKSTKKKRLNKLDELIKARFVEMFGDPISNKRGWDKQLLTNLVNKIGSGATPKGGKESYQDHGISFIRSMNVHDGDFSYTDLAHINSKQANQLSNVIVKSGDVFINITGASVARSCIVPDDILPARVNQHVSIVRCKEGVLNPIFTNNLFLNSSFKKLLLSIGSSGGATRQAITKKQLEELKIILPPISQQNEFANFVQQVDKSKFENIVYLNKTLSSKILSQLGDAIRD
ncbi:restriction endonuclease [Lactobacillus taiwanensis]|uniref:restriction endonuclease subunit S n=1 Tax=Lactobacillus taiwanensis TaxID=508451 RepID=UPI000B984AD9|nr:restriction endonuclease subunit S [Lactobacillus taiwanensis]OYS21715.1 restriction endonuclease [Lactobacillus taiwanensis]OYS25867.1 restriction endonuclease [Lactobacillus taiwanensis]OYS26201.1 restriction endonuclease [Lactobacillus taiwanensis]OYS27987.1 restriction endonuclease [Lactobacillus taiwanensis]OYS36652.1 restriction endonuclease [Lactobacillus taiwanensis]